MAMEFTPAYCPYCEDYVKAERSGINHVLHLLISVLTCGFWFIVWAILILTHWGGWHCSFCGMPLSLNEGPEENESD